MVNYLLMRLLVRQYGVRFCHKHLPYGAIRTLAIIKTNTKYKFGYLDNAPYKHCALAIREVSVRPAHFELMYFFLARGELQLSTG